MVYQKHVCAPHPISEAEPSHPTEETNFSRLYPQSRSFGHYPKLMTMGEGWNADRPVNRKLCQRSGTVPALLQLPHRSACPSHAPFYPNSWTRPEILELFHLRQQLIPNTEGAIHRFSAESHGLRLDAMVHTWLQTALVCARGHGQMKPTEPSSAKSIDAILRSSKQTSPILGCALRSYHEYHEQNQWKGNLGGVQPPLKTYLTLYREYGHSSYFGYTRTRWLVATALVPHTPKVLPIGFPGGHGRKPFPSPQNTCRLDGQKLPLPPLATLQG